MRRRLVLLLAGVLALTVGDPAAAQEPPPSSPVATLAGAHTWLAGITVTLEGTGCVDATTGSAHGLGMMSVLDPGTAAEMVVHAPTAVNDDGTFAFPAPQPAISSDIHQLEPRCVRLTDPSDVVLAYPQIAVRGAPDTTPQDRDLASTLAVGGTLEIDAPCPEAASAVLVFFFGPAEASVLTSYGLEQIRRPVAAGETLAVPVSANGGRPGTYALRVECYRPYPAGFGPGEELFAQTVDPVVLVTGAAVSGESQGQGAPDVSAAPQSTSSPALPGTLPRTGSGTGALVVAGVGLVAAGTAMCRSARRRSS